MSVASTAELMTVLNYVFNDNQLLEMALTHRSCSAPHNERLEFLGDAVLSCFIAEVLYQRFPHAPEGDLSRMRANLVNATVLAEIAQEINLGAWVRLGRGELKTGGMRRHSILADCLEAVIGAVYLDGGWTAAIALLRQWFASRLQQADSIQTIKNAKSLLQEYLQARHFALPTYQVLYVSGQAHRQIFHVTCQVPDIAFTAEGAGASRRLAEHEAAEQMLLRLQSEVTLA